MGDEPASDVVRTVATGVLTYVALIVLLRSSGKRTLSRLNAFDLVVSVALGSILATTLVARTTSVLQGVVAAGVLIGGQFVIAWASVRLGFVRRLVRASPALLVSDGQVHSDVVLETDGTFSVIGTDTLRESFGARRRCASGHDVGRPSRSVGVKPVL